MQRRFDNTTGLGLGIRTCDPKPKPSPINDGIAPESLRRWISARTNRLNSAHWEGARDTLINDDLRLWLPTLRARCAHEVANNGVLEGIISTHCSDIVGAHGPVLQAQTKDRAYGEALESLWQEFAKNCDTTGRLHLPDLLSLWIRSMWLNGEFVSRQVTDLYARTRIKLRLMQIDPRRIDDPMRGLPNSKFRNMIMGVEHNDWWRPLQYWIQDWSPSNMQWAANFEPVSARFMVHGFIVLEAGQARGIPLLSSILQDIADLRDFDLQSMDAMRMAADYAVMAWTQHEDAKFQAIDGASYEDIERRTISFLPAGWQVSALRPEQPTFDQSAYRKERLREYGSPAGMPLMKINHDSSGHNYSSARFDAQGYERRNNAFRAFTERVGLNPLVAAVQREGTLAEILPIQVPADLRLQWTWERLPHVDPYKEAMGEQTRMQNGTLSITQALAANGRDLDAFIEEVKTEKKKFEEAGLTYPLDAIIARAIGAGDTAAQVRMAVEDVVNEGAK